MEAILKYSGLISVLLVIIGWAVIYRNAVKIATRAETKSLMDDLFRIFDSIESLSVDYWLSGRKNRIDSDEFTLLFNAKLLTLNSRLEQLEHRKVDVSEVDLSKLAELITIDCEDVDRKSDSDKRARVQLILDHINKSTVGLYSNFQHANKPVH
ncbi:hypothetical protein WKI32_11560 [Vibrio alginolyticus]|uniref:hypothetical protein n=1 Tax=Vibrio TaxID=662 RepID=UPI001BD20156|nr:MULTISPECIES: hypothetical protein [Vibrio]MBT0024042.1 hypothetical protein [Vibrio alginolyticus]MCA2439469.1 hypothetical protein [Vibrio alginolyticus]MDW1730942.1 hypothetical protein [Vibrio sp. Vb2356]MDW1932066.1 hypothetical protein [Vibrio sp. 970]